MKKLWSYEGNVKNWSVMGKKVLYKNVQYTDKYTYTCECGRRINVFILTVFFRLFML